MMHWSGWAVDGRRVRGACILIMGCLTIVGARSSLGRWRFRLVGFLLIACGILEMLETFRLSNESSQRSAYLSGFMSILVGGLLLNRPKLILGGLALLFAGSFLLDGINKMIAGFRALATGRVWRQESHHRAGQHRPEPGIGVGTTSVRFASCRSPGRNSHACGRLGYAERARGTGEGGPTGWASS